MSDSLGDGYTVLLVVVSRPFARAQRHLTSLLSGGRIDAILRPPAMAIG
jgi:hypothetical protein